MKTQQLQNTSKNVQGTIGNYWLLLGFGLLLIVAALAIQNVSRRAVPAAIPNTGAPVQAQSAPEAGAQGVTNYINAHSNPAAQSVPEAGVQGVAGYLQAHSTDPRITDPAQKGVMDYLRAHGSQVP